MLVALTRGVSPSINDCQLTHLARQPINFDRAVEQHRLYEDCLKEVGVNVLSLPPNIRLPDSVFVEDTVVVVDEVAVIANMSSDIRRQEVEVIASTLSQYRPLVFLKEPAMLDGGDVLRIDRTLYIGISSRTNQSAVTQLRQILEPFGYEVKGVQVKGCLHLKTGCTFIGRNTLLANPSWVDTDQFRGFEILEVPASESWAANALLINNTILFPDSFPQTAELIEERGLSLRQLNISELAKAEAGLTCMSVVFETDRL